jgi:hypothetical protein
VHHPVKEMTEPESNPDPKPQELAGQVVAAVPADHLHLTWLRL